MPAKHLLISGTYSPINRVRLLRAGIEYFDMLLRLVNEAKVSIHIQSYIYDDNETGRMVSDALKMAVKRQDRIPYSSRKEY